MSSSLERSSLFALLPFFSAVPKGDESLDTDQFWGMLVKEQNLSFDILNVIQGTRAKGIKRARMLQEKAAGMLLTLQTLTRSLEEMNASFKKRIDCVARRQGLDSLPDEILSHILGSVTSVFTEALGLSQVCSRFRQVMLDSPHIWANFRLHTLMNPRHVGTLVKRSQNCPLKICIGSQNRCNDWSRRVETLFSLKDRIEDLEFRWLSVDDSKEISRQYNEFQMANLRKLTIKAYSSETSDFYALWSSPNLKCLWLSDFIPAPGFQQISYCHMTFTVDRPLDCLKRFLRSLSSLETLEIELDDLNSNEEERYEEENGVYDADDNYDYDSPWISNITSFSFSIIGKTLIPDARCILETIRLNVTEISLSIVYPKYYPNNCSKIYWRQLYFLQLIRHFPMLEKLQLHFSGPDPDYDLEFDEILFRVPRTLQNLRIEAPGHILSMSGCGHTPLRLRTLQFRNCDRMDLEFLETVRHDFLLNDVVIGKVEVVGCRLVEEEKLQDAFPNSKVVWKT
ncbi:hypothetical protein DFH11DRAFT_1238212 [Phellopilus nigrolimitatus]|nr:hypothetical protein DFH11DRAFT_1238212 [Phellopilus nigrolimitatus]